MSIAILFHLFSKQQLRVVRNRNSNSEKLQKKCDQWESNLRLLGVIHETGFQPHPRRLPVLGGVGGSPVRDEAVRAGKSAPLGGRPGELRVRALVERRSLSGERLSSRPLRREERDGVSERLGKGCKGLEGRKMSI